MGENFADLLFAFKEHLKVKNYSPATIKTYSDYLQRFFSFLSQKEITDIRQVSRQMLKDYQLELTDHRDPKPYTSATIGLNIRGLMAENCEPSPRDGTLPSMGYRPG